MDVTSGLWKLMYSFVSMRSQRYVLAIYWLYKLKRRCRSVCDERTVSPVKMLSVAFPSTFLNRSIRRFQMSVLLWADKFNSRTSPCFTMGVAGWQRLITGNNLRANNQIACRLLLAAQDDDPNGPSMTHVFLLDNSHASLLIIACMQRRSSSETFISLWNALVGLHSSSIMISTSGWATPSASIEQMSFDRDFDPASAL